MTFTTFDISLKDDVDFFTKQLFYALFADVCQKKANHLQEKFIEILEKLQVKNNKHLWREFSESFLSIRKKLDLDAVSFEQKDPACKSLEEVYLAYPGFYAIAVYRLSHQLIQLNIPVLPRMMSESAHSLTGTDIHPGATIGNSFFIDHATGIVIGETTFIGNNVSIFQGVTLGGVHVKKELAETKRHPTIKDNVVVYANATILGGDVIIGENSIIGANVCVTESVLPNSLVIQKFENKILKRKK